ncbi:MAG: GyrI-like domain-containing protein [Methanomassiliicoccus sp.]|nr:GyrI-like domain-containing protein [Methanomassiliicoccus sp.]
MKLDLRKQLRTLYDAPLEPVLVEVPAMNFLMIDGSGDPNGSEEYRQALEALFGLSYTLKFKAKKLGSDYGVLPLEGLWWVDDLASLDFKRKDNWKWTSLIMQPDLVTEEMVEEATEELRRKKDPPALSRMRFERFDEGLAAQVMHIGPYADEGPTIQRLHAFVGGSGHELMGRHHEIYLSDVNRTAPERLRTIIRNPIRPHQ